MARRGFTHAVLAGLIALSAAGSMAQDKAEVDAALANLRPNALPEVQLEALRTIATSLDPRIPAACLPMLESPGNSVRRNAARAIGSRWWQIPTNELPTYTKALKANLGSDNHGIVNMTLRGWGLLNRNYDDSMFSRSPGKRWVIYERRGKPCVIDTHNFTEELLGFDVEGRFLPAFQNDPVAPCCHWHPKRDMVALDMLIFRHPRLVWVWRERGGLRAFGIDELREVLKPANGQLHEYSIKSTDFTKWDGDDLEFTVDYIPLGGPDITTARLRWNSDSDTLRVLSDGIGD